MAHQHRPPNEFARDKNRVVLDGFTIYDHPLDFPNEFVVRRWMVLDGELKPAVEKACRTAATLEEARKLVPPGYICSPRMPDDDARIVESWV